MPKNREQLIRLFLAQQAMVEEYIGGLVSNPSDAQDIMQDVAVEILEKETDPPDDEKIFPAWCRGVARNFVLHYWRSKRRAKVVPDSDLLDLVETAYSEYDADAERWNERRRKLEGCLDKLPEKPKELLALKYGHNLDSQALGRRLGNTPEAVRKTLSRAYQLIRACIKKELAAES